MYWWPEILIQANFICFFQVCKKFDVLLLYYVAQKLCCFPQYLHRMLKFALNSNLKCESTITSIYPGGGRVVWLVLVLSSFLNLNNRFQGQKCCRLAACSFSIALVSWFMLLAFKACYGKPPPSPWISEDLSTFHCLGLWKYMEQFPYKKTETERDILHLLLIACLGYWTDWSLCQYYHISRTCNKNFKII